MGKLYRCHLCATIRIKKDRISVTLAECAKNVLILSSSQRFNIFIYYNILNYEIFYLQYIDGPSSMREAVSSHEVANFKHLREVVRAYFEFLASHYKFGRRRVRVMCATNCHIFSHYLLVHGRSYVL